jgi:putative aldouronate transport system substrate-binding protein
MPSSTAFTRRRFVTASAGAVGAIAAMPLLSACGTSSTASGATSQKAAKSVLPTYKASTAVTADIPSVAGANGAASDPAFLSFPASPANSVTGTVGSGGSYKAITPLWGAAPPKGNSYYSAVNAAIGATVNESPSDGNNYGTMLATLFASGDVPDWLDVPSWNVPAIQDFAEGVQKFFKDLTPYLSGDKVLDYPNLAAIPSGGWQAGVWNGKLYGIPLWTSAASFGGYLFYRADLFKTAGIDASTITSADALKALGPELTNKSKGQYAFDDMSVYLFPLFGVPTVASTVGWKLDSSGKLVSGYETQEYIEFLNFASTIAKSGWVHPSALAGDASDAKNRFWAGKVAITGDGTGAWNKADALSGTAASASYERQAFKVFSYKGGTGTIPLAAGSGMFSYLNKKLSDSQVKEILRIANYFAAPFGSAEYLTVRYGKANTDYTMTSAGPVLNAEGNKVVTDTFDQLANCQAVTFNPGYDQITKDYAAWQADAVKHAYKPLFTGMNFSAPSQYAKGTTALESVVTDVRLGRKTIADYQSALSTWQNVSGNALRSFYEGIAKTDGTGV